jgi:hypothetical protein
MGALSASGQTCGGKGWTRTRAGQPQDAVSGRTLAASRQYSAETAGYSAGSVCGVLGGAVDEGRSSGERKERETKAR